MTPKLATVIFALGVLGLFWLDRDRKARTSKALWIPVVWLLIAGSRPVSAWLAAFGFGAAPSVSTANLYLDGSPIDRNVYMFLLAAGIVVLIGRKQKVGTLLRQNRPILLFFAYCALSVVWSDYSGVAFKRWTKAVGDLVMVLIVLTDPEPAAALKRFLSRTGFVLLPASVLLIKYYPDLGRAYDAGTGVWMAWTPMYTGVTTGKNLLGMTTVVLGLCAAWCVFNEVRNKGMPHHVRHLIAQGTLLAIALWLFEMANSMTSLSCFIMASGLIAVIALTALGRKPAVVHLLVAAVLAVSFSALFLNTGSGLLSHMGRNSTLTGRTDIWKLVLSMKGNALLGTGFESFWLGTRLQKIWSVYWWHPNEAHNGYIDIFLNLGWMGVGLLSVLLVTGYRNIAASLRRNPAVGSLRLGYFVIAVAYDFTESAFRMLNPVWILFLLAIMSVQEYRAPEDSSPTGIVDDDDVTECEAAVDRALWAELPQEII